LLRAKKRDHLTFREIFQRFAAQKNFLRRFIPPNAAVVRIKNNGWGLFPALEHRHLEKSLERALKVMGISG
jgi:hypothetical protein